MTSLDLQAILAAMREDHQPYEYSGAGPESGDGVGCETCDGVEWPCDAARLLAAVEAVVARHQESDVSCPHIGHSCGETEYRGMTCPDAGTNCLSDGEEWPCPTIRALTDALDGA